MKTFLFFIIALSVSTTFAQQTVETDSIFIDSKYREDQFYLSVTYNLLGKTPRYLKQSGFSTGIHFGVIRDMPVNERRNKAIGIGLGLSVNSYNQNMLINELSSGQFNYDIIDERTLKIKRNKFTTYQLELPIEYRWRTSTAKDYKFWRVYSGIKIGYVFYNASKFVGGAPDINVKNNNDFNKLQYGLTLSAGYSTWNFHLYYGLNTIFNDTAQLDAESIDMNSIKIGLVFYIL